MKLLKLNGFESFKFFVEIIYKIQEFRLLDFIFCKGEKL